MVFSFFGRSKAPAPANESGDVAHRSPSPAGSNASVPPTSPYIGHDDATPEASGANSAANAEKKPPLEPSQLRPLLKSIPPKILHEYTLSHLSSASSETIQHLCTFYATLTPPPKLHCVRCHKNYVEVENTDRSCLVPHDDESAEVEHVGTSKVKVAGSIGTTYQTIWGCCGKITEGDGAEGPPDGWCFEGFHTTDVKRARFRADSTIYDDKLTSCERLKCFLTEEEREAARSRRMRARSRKNLREDSESDNEALQNEVIPEDLSDLRSTGTASTSRKSRKSVGGTKKKRKSDASEMQVDGGAVVGEDADLSSALEPTVACAETKASAKTKAKGKEPAKAGDSEQQTPKSKSKGAGMKVKPRPIASADASLSHEGDSTSPLPLQDATTSNAQEASISARSAKPKPKRPRKSLQGKADGGRYVPPRDNDDAAGSSEEEGYGESRAKKRKRKSTVE